MSKRQIAKKPSMGAVIPAGSTILSDIRVLIESARSRVATVANAEITILYWRVGQRIRHEVLNEKRAEYGKEIVATLSQKLTIEYGSGFSTKNLRHMVRFAEVYSYPSDQSIYELF